MEKLFEYYRKLVRETDIEFYRYIYSKINWNSRMIGLTGPRGVGKTTLVLQHIKEKLNLNEALYVTAEDFYFASHRLLDLADAFVKMGGKYLFIDEIHKYKDINKGASDLSRRAVMYQMQGLSFREYLQLFHHISSEVYTLQDMVTHKVDIPGLEHPLPLFHEYLQTGYYPFALEDDYDIRLRQIINLTLESDIPQFADMNVSTGRKLKQLLAIIAKSVPFKPNFSSIAKVLEISRNNISDYCLYIEEAGLIAQLRDATGGVRGLGKVDKIYLDNTNLIYNLAQENSNIGNVRETFFLNQTRAFSDVVTSPVSDFLIDKMTFEIGGKKKGQKQIQGIEKGFIVKDDIEQGFMNVIPLWQFGMGY